MIRFDAHYVHSLEVSSSDDQRPQRWWDIKVIGKTPDVRIGLFNLPQPTGKLLQTALSPITTPDEMIEAFVNYRSDSPTPTQYTITALNAAQRMNPRLEAPLSELSTILRLLHPTHLSHERLDQSDSALIDLRSAFETLCDELCDESASLRAQLQPE